MRAATARRFCTTMATTPSVALTATQLAPTPIMIWLLMHTPVITRAAPTLCRPRRPFSISAPPQAGRCRRVSAKWALQMVIALPKAPSRAACSGAQASRLGHSWAYLPASSTRAVKIQATTTVLRFIWVVRRCGRGWGLLAGRWVISMAVFLVARRAWKREAWLLSWA